MALIKFAAWVALGLLAVAPPVFAWGHLRDFGVQETSGSLIFDVIDSGRIGFCVQSEDRRYDEDEMTLIVEASLAVWLDAVEDLIGDEIALEADCDVLTLDLMVLFGEFDGVRSPDGVADIAFKTRLQRGANHFSAIGFNTVGTAASSGEPLIFMSPLDFLPAKVGREQALEYLAAVSTAAPRRFIGRDFGRMERVFGEAAEAVGLTARSRRAVGSELGIDDNPIDIYPVMIHEFGHGFGLCDMREAAYEPSCNRFYRTELTTNSLMAFGGYRLRDDDLEGIRSLFERFLRRPFLDQRIFGDDDRQITDRYDRSLVEISRLSAPPVIGFFAGDCRTVATAGQGLLPGGELLRDPARVFSVRPMWRETALEIDWAASDFSMLTPASILSSREPENDFFILPLAETADGCEPLIVDGRRADMVINETGSFTVVSLGGFGESGRIEATGPRAQDSSSCAILRRDFGNKYYRDPLTFVTDCDLTRGNAGSPVFHEDGDRRILLGLAVGADRLPQNLRDEIAYRVPGGRRLPLFDRGPTFRGEEGNIAGANLFLRLGGPFLAALAQAAD